MTTIPAPMFSFPIADDAVLIPRTAAITDAYHELVAENTERLARWEPWADKPPVLDETRSFLEASGRNWLDGSELPVAIAVNRGGQWHLAGALSLTISGYTRSAEIGYWIGADYEGQGLVTRAAASVVSRSDCTATARSRLMSRTATPPSRWSRPWRRSPCRPRGRPPGMR